MHFSHIQQHFEYEISRPTEFIHPLPPIGPPFAVQGALPQLVIFEPCASSQPAGNDRDDCGDEEDEDDNIEEDEYRLVRK